MPNVHGNKSSGWYRRLLIIPFNADFNGVKENPKIKEEYINDSRVLEYLLHKAINLEFDKFIEPQAVKESVEKYKAKNDLIRAYIIERYVAENYDYFDKVPISFIKHDYGNFLQENRSRSAIPYAFVGEFVDNLNEVSEYEFEYKVVRFNNDYLTTLPREIREFAKPKSMNSVSKI